jgi:hypothetical protein
MLYNKRLQDAGFTKEQAEESINVLWDVMHENLATKQDLSEVKNELSKKMADLETDMKLLESKMTIKLGSLLIVSQAVLYTLLKMNT